MRYPRLLQCGDTIGVCAPSSGVRESAIPQLVNAKRNVGTIHGANLMARWGGWSIRKARRSLPRR